MKTSQDTTNSEMNYKQFYKELGHLLYAVAYSDGKVRKKEVNALREFVLKELAPFEPSKDSSGMNQAFYTQFEFDDIVNKNEEATVVFSSFMDYLQKNISSINEHLKSSMIEAVEKVAQAYKRTNKLEQGMINNLKQEIAAL
ncbi:MAG: hypothetical protein IM600_13075 [Bacteroidetes bacterium]|jgi:uncharacterized tellurite resistance protein B-like protein|nr:hypothetical protein [Bacteroidota bacterium]MCA6444356.1 hypothetical protein [Bacteroidota bacterium]